MYMATPTNFIQLNVTYSELAMLRDAVGDYWVNSHHPQVREQRALRQELEDRLEQLIETASQEQAAPQEQGGDR